MDVPRGVSPDAFDQVGDSALVIGVMRLSHSVLHVRVSVHVHGLVGGDVLLDHHDVLTHEDRREQCVEHVMGDPQGGPEVVVVGASEHLPSQDIVADRRRYG